MENNIAKDSGSHLLERNRQLRYNQQVALRSALTRLTAESAPSSTFVPSTELTAAWRSIQKGLQELRSDHNNIGSLDGMSSALPVSPALGDLALPPSDSAHHGQMVDIIKQLLRQRDSLTHQLREARRQGKGDDAPNIQGATQHSTIHETEDSDIPSGSINQAENGARLMIAALREQIEQVQQRENEWRRQVNTLQLLLDDAKEEYERSQAEHVEEVSKLQKTIDLLLQDIEIDIGHDDNVDKDVRDDKVQMLRKVRNAINRVGSQSPVKNPTQALRQHYEEAVCTAIKEEEQLLVSQSDGSRLGSNLNSQMRKISMRKAPSSEAATTGLAGDHALATSQRSDQDIPSLSASRVLPNGLAHIQPIPALVVPAAPAPALFHANNPNQIGEVMPKGQFDESWMLIESIKAGLKAEVCKYLLDHYEESQKPKREGPLKGIVKGLVNTVAAAASTVAATVSDPVPPGTDIAKETTEYFCHLASDAVTTRRTLPTSLPPLKEHNSNKQLLSVFHGINAAYAPDPAIGSSESLGQGRLVCRGDQIRLRFFAPRCFAMIRQNLSVDPEHLRLSIEQCDWRRSMSPGKSEAMLFYFGDYVLKTVKNVEAAFLKSTYVPAFTTYTASNPYTLLPSFMTFFSVTWLYKNETVDFVLTKNVFGTHLPLDVIYDLKGSTVGREAAREEDGPKAEVKRTAFGALLLKDNDLPSQLIYCGPLRRAVMIAQLQSDTNFLQSLNIVDYSLMVGVRSRVVSKGGSEEQRAPAALADVDGSCLHSSNGGLLSMAIYDEHDMTTVREDTYYIGIIDCLQPYNSSKKLEHFAKGLIHDPHAISVVPPEEYAERLCRLVERITV